MIKDKNVFECIILENHIWFPNYVYWGPPSVGHQRRKALFKTKFPDMESAISTKDTWDRLRKKHKNKRRIFRYDEESRTLNEINVKDFFLSGWGEPVYLGDTFELKGELYQIEGLEIIRWAGLIAKYTDKQGKVRKINFSFYKKSKDKIWRNNPD